MLKNLPIVLLCLCFAPLHLVLPAQAAEEACQRPSPGSTVTEPADLRSRNGVLKVELTARNAKQSDGSTRYCFVDENGAESPTLRVKFRLSDGCPSTRACGYREEREPVHQRIDDAGIH
jgi:hypothetical protein